MLKKAEAKVDPVDRARFNIILCDLDIEEYHDEPFDIIYSQMVLHHIKDTNAILRKFYNLLKPGGILAIADLYLEDGSFHDGDTSVHFGFDPEELTAILHQIGFNNITNLPCFVMQKEISADNIKEYPIFLMTAFSQV